jgi:hypothetical protein
VDVIRHYHRGLAPAVALALALAVAAPASARLELNPPPTGAVASGPAGPSPCSEVCSGGGYSAVAQPAVISARTNTVIPHGPRPRGQVVTGDRASSETTMSSRAGHGGPPTAAVSGGGYAAPRTVVRAAPTTADFHWGDAGIGAGSALALATVLIGGALVVMKVRRRSARGATQPTT